MEINIHLYKKDNCFGCNIMENIINDVLHGYCEENNIKVNFKIFVINEEDTIKTKDNNNERFIKKFPTTIIQCENNYVVKEGTFSKLMLKAIIMTFKDRLEARLEEVRAKLNIRLPNNIAEQYLKEVDILTEYLKLLQEEEN